MAGVEALPARAAEGLAAGVLACWAGRNAASGSTMPTVKTAIEIAAVRETEPRGKVGVRTARRVPPGGDGRAMAGPAATSGGGGRDTRSRSSCAYSEALVPAAST